ncbi:MAG TPA: flagellar biosynthetic protein FliO [Planctomycetota bacterium]|nr:flagellar biosynthetic protein FliO [Planctomycetota bacterium]
MRLIIILLLLAPTLLPSGEGAAGSVPPDATLFSDTEWAGSERVKPAGDASVGGAVVQLAVALAVVLGVALAAGWALKRLNVRRFAAARGANVRLVETVSIGHRRAVSLLRIGDQVLVVGQGEHELCHLATLPASVLAEPPAAAPGAVTTDAPTPSVRTEVPEMRPPKAFAAVLERFTGKRP